MSVNVRVWVNWPLLCNKSSICPTLLRLSSETNFHEWEYHPQTYVCTIVIHRHFDYPFLLEIGPLSLTQLYVICVCSHPTYTIPTIARIDNNCSLTVQCTYNSCIYLSDPVSMVVNQIFLQITKMFFFIPAASIVKGIKLVVCICANFGFGYRNSHTVCVLLSYCTNYVQSWTILNFGCTLSKYNNNFTTILA